MRVCDKKIVNTISDYFHGHTIAHFLLWLKLLLIAYGHTLGVLNRVGNLQPNIPSQSGSPKNFPICNNNIFL